MSILKQAWPTRPREEPRSVSVTVHLTGEDRRVYLCQGVGLARGGQALILHNVTQDPLGPSDPYDLGIPLHRISEWREKVSQ